MYLILRRGADFFLASLHYHISSISYSRFIAIMDHNDSAHPSVIIQNDVASHITTSPAETSPLLPKTREYDGKLSARPDSLSTFSRSSSISINSRNASVEDAGGNDDGNSDDETIIFAEEVSGARLWVIMGTVWVGVFFGAMDATIIATLSASISNEFRSLSLLSWLAAAYLVANAAFQPISGRLTDIFGRGPGLVLSNLLFAAGNLICGIAHDERTVILGRVVAGIGGGGLMSISTFLGSDLVSLRRRGIVQGVGNICYGTGAMCGSVLGGFINDTLGWRSAFLIQVPPVLVSTVLVAWLVRVPAKHSNRSYLSRVDFGGVFFLVLFLAVLLLGLNAGGNIVPWTHPLVLVSIPFSLLSLMCFLTWEDRIAKQPVIPVRLLLSRTVSAACITNLLCTMILMMALFYVPIYLQVLGSSATEAGLRILTSPLGISVASLGSGYIMKRTGRYYLLGIMCTSVHVAGIVILTLLDENAPPWLASLMFFLLGAGYGAVVTITLLALVAAVDHTNHSVITSASYAFRSVGATLGVTVASTIYQNVLRSHLWDRFGNEPDAANHISRLRDDLSELDRLPESWKGGVILSFMEAFKSVWFTALGLGISALVSIALMREHVLHTNLARR